MSFAYFQDSWCQFDFFLVVMSLLDQFFLDLLVRFLPIPPTMLRVLRVARVLRILRLLKNLKGLRDLIMTLVFAFPALVNIAGLLCIVMFMYSVLGMNTFTFVLHGEALNAHNNFETFSASMLLLFQCLTGDGWSELMDDAMINEERGCEPSPDDGAPSNCGSPLALPFFISFTIIGSFIFINLVVAVILENFSALGNVNPDLVSAADIADFKEEWSKLDPDADGIIETRELPSLVMNLRAPLGLKGSRAGDSEKARTNALRFCLGLGLTQQSGRVSFKATLDALIQKNYGKKAALPGVAAAAVTSTAKDETRKGDAGDGAEAPCQLTPRREMASVYANELISDYIKVRRVSSVGRRQSLSMRTVQLPPPSRLPPPQGLTA